MFKKIRYWFKSRKDLKNHIIEKERKIASEHRLMMIEEHEEALKEQYLRLKKEFKNEVSEISKEKLLEIKTLRKIIRNLKDSSDEVAIMAHEFEVDLKIVVNSIARIQHRLGILEDKAYRHTQKINKQLEKYFPEGIDPDSLS